MGLGRACAGSWTLGNFPSLPLLPPAHISERVEAPWTLGLGQQGVVLGGKAGLRPEGLEGKQRTEERHSEGPGHEVWVAAQGEMTRGGQGPGQKP